MLCSLNRAIGGGIRCRDERGWMPAQPVPTWRAGPWDIASRAHIHLRSSEFGLSGFLGGFSSLLLQTNFV